MAEDSGHSGQEASGAMSESDNEYDETDHIVKDEDENMADHPAGSEGADTSSEPKKKYDPKDPLRPRRKKARRACYACQRAHLTCGTYPNSSSPSPTTPRVTFNHLVYMALESASHFFLPILLAVVFVCLQTVGPIADFCARG